jgi:hypothetical protein
MSKPSARKFKREAWVLKKQQERLLQEIQADETGLRDSGLPRLTEDDDLAGINQVFGTAIHDFHASFEDSLE